MSKTPWMRDYAARAATVPSCCGGEAQQGGQSDSVPTSARTDGKMGTAQGRLCPPHELRTHTSSTASAPFTASAESVTVFSSEVACTAMFSAKNRASAT